MGLTRLEESKLKKSTYVEIHDDEEEDGEWDDERNKQFEKLIAETIAIRKKMEKICLP